MATDIELDTKEFNKRISQLVQDMSRGIKAGLFEVGGEVMRLSSFEVPHDRGLLQNSGQIEETSDDVVVGYNKVYAARLHEHPEFRFQKGRKGKYLEDPIKNNIKVFLDYLGERIKTELQ